MKLLDGEKFTETGCNMSIGHEGDVPLGLKNPKYRLLIVANKFQTGFDEPLVQSMYVDKKIRWCSMCSNIISVEPSYIGKNTNFRSRLC